ncbi:MAG: FecR domain-containing protein [Phycisphaerae bacterium]|nr:FecR domain-containing protein [Phycisphaerae bacterium]
METNEKIEIIQSFIQVQEGSISPEKFQELNELIVADPFVAQFYIDFMVIQYGIYEVGAPAVLPMDSSAEDAQSARLLAEMIQYEEELKAWHEEEKTRLAPVCNMSVDNKDYQRKRPSATKLWQFAGAIAAIVAFAFLLNMLADFAQFTSSPPVVARLTDQVGVRWAEDSSMYTGAPLRPGQMILEEGLAFLTFEDGAEVIIQGPCQFNLETANKMQLAYGKLFARVSTQATGFTVKTPCSTIIDIGTEFGVESQRNGSSALYMHKGKAVFIPGKKEDAQLSQLVAAGQAVKVDRSDLTIHQINMDKNKFIDLETFDIMSFADKGSEYHQWLLYCIKLRQDPSLVAYYDFGINAEQSKQIKNLSERTFGHLNGEFISGLAPGAKPEWEKGRWPETTALRFNRSHEDYVEIQHDPALNLADQTTIVCWLWLDNEFSGGHILSKRIKGQITGQSNGRLQGFQFAYFGKSPPQRDIGGKAVDSFQYIGEDIALTKPFERILGQWQHIAVTCDKSALRFYINGQIVDELPGQTVMTLSGSDLRIGRESFDDQNSKAIKTDFTSFDGMIDEIAIFNRALSETEVFEMYKASKP